jgi:rubrerythrin
MWHLSLFEPSELIQVAVEIEKSGAATYRRLQEKAVSAPLKELLVVLAEEEEKHQRDFLALGEDYSLADPPETYPGEYQDYVRSLVETHLFSNPKALEDLVEEARTEKDILQLAARLEKDTILFFNGMRRVIKPQKQGVIEGLIVQEENHLVKLGMLLKEASK